MSVPNEELNAPQASAIDFRDEDTSTKSLDSAQIPANDDRSTHAEKLANSQKSSSTSSPCPSELEVAEERIVVSFNQDDKTNPYNWSRPKKMYVVLTGMLMVINSTMGSALPSGAIGTIEQYWDIRNQEHLVLPVSIYLIGYILGPMVFAPLSEEYGRKLIMICTFVMFTCFVLACALAPNFGAFIVFRLLAGIGASTPVSVIGGIYADLYATKRARGVAITAFMAGTTWGPLLGPVISGFVSVAISWRWVFWVELIFAGATWPLLLCMPETFGPVILRRRAKKLRKETGNSQFVAPAELDRKGVWEIIAQVVTRPIRMFLFEAIVLFSCIYLSLAYGIFYIFFQAFDPIYAGTYGFNPGEVGLCFVPIGVGSVIAAGVYLLWDWYLDKAQRRSNPPAWSQKEEYVRLPLACIGGPLIVTGLLWLGWTARPDIHWIVPILSALPFGIGFLLIFMSLINYVVDAYEVYAASAMGATSASRSIFGVILPFAAGPMYSTLGIAWACTLLAILSALMCLIPFFFIRFGERIRANSSFCQELKRKKAEDEEKQRQLWERPRKANEGYDAEKQP